MGSDKKGLGVLGWLAIGCGCLVIGGGLVVGGLTWWGARKVKGMVERFEENPALAAAEAYAALNPEVEVAGSDPDSSTVTLRNTKTGEEVTVDLEEIKEGKISFSSEGKELNLGVSEEEGVGYTVTDESGEVTHRGGVREEGAPAWIPRYPGGEASGVYAAEDPKQISGGLGLDIADASREAVADFYRSEMEAAGFEIESSFEGEQAGTSTQMLSAKDVPGGRTLTVVITETGGAVKVALTFQEKKE